MQLLNPIFAILLTLVAILCVRTTFLWSASKPAAVSFATIDGLRGYLAFFVFLHHASIWLFFCRTGKWTAPESYLYTHLGQGSVALFFMITSFLFYEKLLRSQFTAMQWRSFFINRFFRLTPLYIAVMLALFATIAVLSQGELLDKPRYLLFCVARWLSFTILGSPHINHIDTSLIVAGVTWSLPYEWCFYLILPLIALTARQRPPLSVLIVGGAGLILSYWTGLQMSIALFFAGGLIAARLIRHTWFTDFCRRRRASIVALSCMFALTLFPTAYAVVPCILLTVAFCLIAGGADLFGLLRLHTSRRLGELAYSIYLVHGILLFCLIHFFVTKENVAALSGMEYWAMIATLVPVLLLVTAATHHYIEQPGIRIGKKFAARGNINKMATQCAPHSLPGP